MATRKRRRRTRRVNQKERREDYFTDLVYKRSGRTRFTQDSPILADVFVHYGLKNDDEASRGFDGEDKDGDDGGDFHLDLLITPHLSRTATQLADELRSRLIGDDRDAPKSGSPFYIAPNQSVVAIRLTFEELLRYVLPMSWWWDRRLIAVEGLTIEKAYRDPGLRRLMREQLVAGLEHELKGRSVPTRGHRWLIQQDAIWAARLFYLVQHSNRPDEPDARDDDAEAMADYFLEDIVGWVAKNPPKNLPKNLLENPPGERAKGLGSDDPWTYTINRNRPVAATVFDSIRTMKADAATRTFETRGKGIRWAVVDSGIDATHPAFRRYDGDGKRHAQAFVKDGDQWKTNTRIKKTYDFSTIRKQLSQTDLRPNLRALLGGRMLDWAAVIKKLKLELPYVEEDPPHKERRYETPGQAHGTHVAGILAADWRPDDADTDPLGPRQTTRKPPEPLLGVCPDIELYDLRVFDKDGNGDEFSVISALQFVRWINQQHDVIEIHGVNLSLAMRHEVNNYACGRSPVCEECTRLVGNGVVVVAAAGNAGRSVHLTTDGGREDGYRSISISDPGNAEAVITVGSTHRREPHTYGVSYFSSRGPTGDGRLKPDLVAPGEKITSTVPGSAMAQQDGTSQAAPHVSGAAALLMSRHTEFIGQPARVKKILMDSAIDLGRERHFQGAGLVDVFGAIQSV